MNHILKSVVVFFPLVALAQPPEEIPPVYSHEGAKVEKQTTTTTSTEKVQTIIIPATTNTLNNTSTNVDLTPPPSLAPKPVEEDDTMKALSTAFSVGVYPFGFDNMNIGQDVAGESNRYFFQVQPGINFGTKLKTKSGKKIDLGLSYSLIWREYYNKADTSRDFEHDVSASLGTRWNDLLSSSLSADGVYFFKAGTDANEDSAFLVDTNAGLSFDITKQISAQIGYWNRYLASVNHPIPINETNAATDTPGDIDDFRRGGLFNDSTYDSSTDSYIDPYSGEIVQLTGDVQTQWMMHNSIVTGAKWQVTSGTKVNFSYTYTFLTTSNDDFAKWTGHFIKPSISQDLPWKGGSVSLTEELRLRHFDYKKTSTDPDAARQDLRNRFTISFNQGVNDFITLQAYFRWELNGRNDDDYGNLKSYFHSYLGTNISF